MKNSYLTIVFNMNLDIKDMVKEVKEKKILHWNYRGLIEIPNAVRSVCSHVEEIYLKWNKLKSLPLWISDFSNITNLYLYGNSIEELPDSFRYMSKLTILDLSVNQLKQIPSCLVHLKNLRSLILNHNFISSLPQCETCFLKINSFCLKC
jgi:Leucine-rich repeat (LRR) protein